MRVIDDGTAVRVAAPAKLNLFLAIRGRRPDGFHELETLMTKVSVFDSLAFSSRPDEQIVLRVTSADRDGGHTVPAGPGNLVVRAAELLRHRVGIRFGADVRLEKRIPAEAGLAGGSSDAAAALAGLNRLWRLGLGVAELAGLGSELGSDVPFFFAGSNAAVARGRGEIVEPVAIGGPFHFVVVKPPFGLPTAGVYRAFAERCRPSGAEASPLIRSLAAGRLAEAGRRLYNDLAAAAEFVAPTIAPVREKLAAECRYGGLMTGSGSACFGLCGSAREAAAAASRLRAAGVGRAFTAMSA